jgi:hypothetical protein
MLRKSTISLAACALTMLAVAQTPNYGGSGPVATSDASTGTTTGQAVVYSANNTVTNAGSFTTGILGVATATGTGITQTICNRGLCQGLFIGAATVNDYVQVDGSTGRFKDAGNTFPTAGGEVLGTIASGGSCGSPPCTFTIAWRANPPNTTTNSSNGYNQVQSNGSNQMQRQILNLKGTVVSCADNSGAASTDCTFTGGNNGYNQIQANGTNQTQRQILNLKGTIVSCADNSGAGSTDCVFTGSAAGGGSRTIAINLGVGQGSGGCSLAWNFLSATAPTCVLTAGSSTQPQFAAPQFTVAGAIGTGTALYIGPLTIPSNYTANSNLTINLALACPSVTTGTVTFNARYADITNPAAVQPSFFATDYTTGAVTVSATANNSVIASIVFTPGNGGSPSVTAGDQLFFVIYLNTMSALQNPYLSQMYITY